MQGNRVGTLFIRDSFKNVYMVYKGLHFAALKGINRGYCIGELGGFLYLMKQS